jgi:anti-sigma B factor antagonist
MDHDDTTRVHLLSHRTPTHTIMTVRGELDVATSAALRDQIVIALTKTTIPVIIDLSGVSFCDASGLAVLVGAQRQANLHGLTVVLAAPQPSVRKALRATGLDRAFTIHPTLAGARLAGRTRRDAAKPMSDV